MMSKQEKKEFPQIHPATPPFVAVDKSLVHKKKGGNVLISNLRRALPLTLKNLSSKFIKKYPELHKYYHKQPENSSNIYIFRLSEVEIHTDLTHTSAFKEINGDLRETETDSRYFCFKKKLSSSVKVKAADAIEKLGLYPDEVDRVNLSNALEKQVDVAKRDQFYAHLRVNPKHSFFFEHSNDHIPGMKLIEAIRQMGTACWHLYGKAPLKDSHFILSGIQVNFFNYVDIHHPIRLCGVFNDIVYSTEGVWLSYKFECEVYQNGNLCVRSVMPGKMIHPRLYKRLRKRGLKLPANQRFHPVVSDHIRLELRSEVSRGYMSIELRDISYLGFRAVLDFQKHLKVPDIEWEFCIRDDERHWEVRGYCRQIWKQKEGYSTGFRFLSFEEGSENSLIEIITRFCVLIPLRGEGLRLNRSEGRMQ